MAGAKLSLHQDRDEKDAWAPIVSVSLGLPAVFLWGGKRRADPVRRLRVESGDVAVWGGPARFVYHGVAPLKDGRHPLTGDASHQSDVPEGVLMDHHAVAAVSVAGIGLDVLGGLYLAYDLLGGQHGPLRLLTRMVTYALVFGLGYGLGLGLFFGLATGTATGITIAIELNRTARNQGHYPLPWEAVFSAIRGFAFGAGLYRTLGIRYALAFGVTITVGQVLAYVRGIRPSLDYAASRRSRFTRRQWRATVVRTAGYIVTAIVCSSLVRHVDHAWLFALRVGLVTGVVTAAGTVVNPYIEYYADNLPERRLGVFGIWLVLCGFFLQSVQYWVAILDIPVT